MKKIFLLRFAVIIIAAIAFNSASAQVIIAPRPAQTTVINGQPVIVRHHYPRRTVHTTTVVRHDNGKHKGWYKHKGPKGFRKHDD